MQKHIAAVGHFILAVFCIHAGHQPLLQSMSPMLFPILMVGAAVAFVIVIGTGFFVSASLPWLQSMASKSVSLFHLARRTEPNQAADSR